jgi:hypothetical protein
MTDYVHADTLVRISLVPELDPVQDKIMLQLRAKRTDGYAREDDLIILEPTVVFVPEFDAFALSGPARPAPAWVDVAFRNEGSNVAIVTMSDGIVASFRQRLEAGQTIVLRHNRAIVSAPSLVSTLGTRIRMFAWGEPW